MQDFTQIGSQSNNDFFNEEAVKTLDSVMNDWQSGKQVVEWTVIPPADPQELAKRERILKFIMISDAISMIVSAILVVSVGGLEPPVSFYFLIAIIIGAICEIFFFTPYAVKMLQKNPANAITVKIDRNKKLAVITRQQHNQKIKYGSQSTIPAFRLPENHLNDKDAQIKSQLQQQITAETGCLFEEVV